MVDREKDRAIREQAVTLTQAVFTRIRPAPLRSVNQVAPIVYALLLTDVEPSVIEQALINARAHTQSGIDYALRQIMPPVDTAAKPRYRDIEVEDRTPPSEQEKAAAHVHIAAARAAIKGDRSGLA